MQCNSEHLEQVTFVTWFKENYPEYVIFSVPNGELRNITVANRLKLEGVLSGVSDLIVLLPNGKTLFIEFKKQKGGVVSKNQKEFFKNLDRLGFDYFVAYGFKDGIEKIKNYI